MPYMVLHIHASWCTSCLPPVCCRFVTSCWASCPSLVPSWTSLPHPLHMDPPPLRHTVGKVTLRKWATQEVQVKLALHQVWWCIQHLCNSCAVGCGGVTVFRTVSSVFTLRFALSRWWHHQQPHPLSPNTTTPVWGPARTWQCPTHPILWGWPPLSTHSPSSNWRVSLLCPWLTAGGGGGWGARRRPAEWLHRAQSHTQCSGHGGGEVTWKSCDRRGGSVTRAGFDC